MNVNGYVVSIPIHNSDIVNIPIHNSDVGPPEYW